MSRTRRIVLPGVPHHITQRGNNQQAVFFTDDDRKYFLSLLVSRCKIECVRIWAYCLMINHVHLVAVPSDETGLAAALGWTFRHYAQYLNARRECTGHVWQERFFSKPMDARHTVAAMRYVERNPVRAGIVEHAWDYPWSSAAAHCGLNPTDSVIDPSLWNDVYPPNDWQKLLQDSADAGLIKNIRRPSRRGRPRIADQSE